MIEVRNLLLFAVLFLCRSRSAPKNSAKVTGKHLFRSLFLIKFQLQASSRLQLYMKKEAPTQLFSYEFCEIFKNTFFTEPSRRLLLSLLVFLKRFELLRLYQRQSLREELLFKKYVFVSKLLEISLPDTT